MLEAGLSLGSGPFGVFLVIHSDLVAPVVRLTIYVFELFELPKVKTINIT